MENYIFDSKIGNISVSCVDDLVSEIRLTKEEVTKNKPNKHILEIITKINDYLEGKMVNIEVPILCEGTVFQKTVITNILAIKYGETITYKELAIRSGYPKAYRAVGTVCKNNKLPIVIPCHRVVKSNGEIGEYLLGKSIKMMFLNIEKNYKFY